MTGDLRLLHGDALDLLRADALGYPHALGYHPDRLIPDASIDAIVTDPPYGLEFMGVAWDTIREDGAPRARNEWGDFGSREHARHPSEVAHIQRKKGLAFYEFSLAWATEVFRVLKPGGHLLAFGSTRTVHRLTCGIEDAGFEIRDGIDWLYGSGFPKSLDVSKAIDKAAGAQREVIGAGPDHTKRTAAAGRGETVCREGGSAPVGHILTAAATDDAARWSGWGTALKPAREPIVVARKPLAGTVAANVLEHGTGALNIDACRVAVTDAAYAANCSGDRGHADNRGRDMDFRMGAGSAHDGGRWPSNVVLSHSPWCEVCECGARGPHDETPHCYAGDVDCLPGCPVAELDAQSGTTTSSGGAGARSGRLGYHGGVDGANLGGNAGGLGDTGGASRFFPVFRYQAKAPARERPKVAGVAHPTVKPLALMRWLVRLVCPPGGTVLDLFAGSGTTGEACIAEGFPCLLIERDADYLPLIAAREARTTQAVLI